MNFIDAVTIAGTKKRQDGALIVDANTARTGIQVYMGSEVGKPDLKTVNVFRGADEVFSRDSLASFAHRPITVDHPNEAVTAENWAKYAVGQTADEVTAHDIYVRVPLMISDGDAIKTVEGGKRQLSVGYDCDLDWTPGITKDGIAFDARQRNIRVNHIAIVDSGRAGSQVRIGDGFATPLQQDQGNKTMKTILVDGLPIADVSDAAEIVINRFQAQVKTLTDAATAAIAEHRTIVATKDTEIGTLKADVKKLTDAAVTPEILDKMVTDRVTLVGLARAIVTDVKVDGLTDADIRKAVVTAKYGADFVKDQPEAAIGGMFAALAKDVKPGTATSDPFRIALITATPITDANDPTGQTKWEKSLADAWKGPAVAA